VSDDDGPTKWVAMVKTTKLNYEKTTLVVGEHKKIQRTNKFKSILVQFCNCSRQPSKWIHWPAKWPSKQMVGGYPTFVGWPKSATIGYVIPRCTKQETRTPKSGQAGQELR
jgi:hypothetical protein